MKIKTGKTIEEFRATVNECKGEVWLTSNKGDKINLKSIVSQYVAIGALLDVEGDNLELYCSKREDEERFFKFFNENPEVLS